MCVARGQGWFYDIRNAIVIAAGLKIFGLSTLQSFILAGFVLLMFLVIGYIDLRYGIWLKENEITTRELNPYFKKLEDNIK